MLGALVLAGCGSFSVPEVEDALNAAEAEPDPERAATLLTVGLLDPGASAVPARCAAEWRDIESVDPERRAQVLTAALMGWLPACPNPCDSETFRALAMAHPDVKMQFVREGCAADVFSADPALAPLYDRFDLGDWLVLHVAIDAVVAADGPEAKRIRALAPRLAVGMVGEPFDPNTDADRAAPGGVKVTSAPAGADVRAVVEERSAGLRACLPSGADHAAVRLVFDTSGRLARVVPSYAARTEASCWSTALSGAVWPLSGAAVVDVAVAR